MARLILLHDLLSDLEAAYAARYQAAQTGQLRAPITGFDQIDRELGGALATGMHVLQSAPGVGKTALGLQAAALCGFPALFVTCELTALTLFERLIAREMETDLSAITRGELPPATVGELADRTASKLPHFGILDASLEGANADLITETATKLRDAAATHSLLVVIDSLQVWSRAGAMGGLFSDYDLITAGLHALRRVAIKLEIPVLVTSHRSRAGQERGGLFTAKGSGDIEYGAEVVLELTRDLNDKPDHLGEVPVTLTVLKNRHGDAGRSFALLFCGALQRFRHSTGPAVSLNPQNYTSGPRKKP